MKKTKSRLGRRMLLVFSVLCTVLPLQTAAQTTLHVWKADGTTTDIRLYTRPLVTFEGDKVVITSPVATFTYDAREVLRFTYSGTETAVRRPKGDASYRQEGKLLIFDAKVKSSEIHLFSEDGKRLPTRVQNVHGRPTLSLSTLAAGVYVLSVNGQTSKILKR